MAEIATDQGRFTADITGPADGPLVVLLHGFPQSRHSWRHQLPRLGEAGYRAAAPDGRGYSPGVRPDPADGLEPYAIGRLAADVIDIADACATGAGTARFHLVGHDWGGHVAWVVAHQHPERIASLTVLSRPHPGAFRQAFRSDADGQRHRSRHHASFHDAATARLLLADDARRLRASLGAGSVPDAHIDEYLGVLGDVAALDAALAWYRAAGALTNVDVGPITVPTLYVWGDADATVGQTAAEATADFVHGPYRFERLTGVGHFITDEVPESVTSLLLDHLRSHPA